MEFEYIFGTVVFLWLIAFVVAIVRGVPFSSCNIYAEAWNPNHIDQRHPSAQVQNKTGYGVYDENGELL